MRLQDQQSQEFTQFYGVGGPTRYYPLVRSATLPCISGHKLQSRLEHSFQSHPSLDLAPSTAACDDCHKQQSQMESEHLHHHPCDDDEDQDYDKHEDEIYIHRCPFPHHRGGHCWHRPPRVKDAQQSRKLSQLKENDYYNEFISDWRGDKVLNVDELECGQPTVGHLTHLERLQQQQPPSGYVPRDPRTTEFVVTEAASLFSSSDPALSTSDDIVPLHYRYKTVHYVLNQLRRGGGCKESQEALRPIASLLESRVFQLTSSKEEYKRILASKLAQVLMSLQHLKAAQHNQKTDSSSTNTMQHSVSV